MCVYIYIYTYIYIGGGGVLEVRNRQSTPRALLILSTVMLVL